MEGKRKGEEDEEVGRRKKIKTSVDTKPERVSENHKRLVEEAGMGRNDKQQKNKQKTVGREDKETRKGMKLAVGNK